MTKLDIPELLIPNDKYEPKGNPPPPDPNPDPNPPPGPNPASEVCFITQNWGPHGKAADFTAMIKQFKPHTINFQEVGDQKTGVQKVIHDTGYHSIDGSGLPGQSSTITLWNPELLNLRHTVTVPIHHDTRIKNNNHQWMRLKEKWFIGGSFGVKGSKFRFIEGCVHWVFNMDMEPNGHIGTESSHNFAKRTARFDALFIAGGDWNSKADSPHMKPIRDAHFHSAQEILGNIDTGHGPIDDIKFRYGKPDTQKGNRLRIKSGRAIHNSSDHHGFVVWAEIV